MCEFRSSVVLRYYHTIIFSGVVPNSTQVRNLACNCSFFVCFYLFIYNLCFQTLCIICCLHILYAVPYRDMETSSTADSYLKLNFIMVLVC